MGLGLFKVEIPRNFDVSRLHVVTRLVVNPFDPNFSFLYALETAENLWFYDVFMGIEIKH